MNPFFEQQWRDAHTSLLMYVRDALQEVLPADLVARAEEETVSIGADGPGKTYRPDVQVRETWTLRERSVTQAGPASSASQATEPIRVSVKEETERWLEIHDATGRLITVIELLSPSNKLESAGREDYLHKRRSFIRSGINLLEIDLVRQGSPVFPGPVRNVLGQAGACYGICVFRTARPAEYEVYPIRLRERLPTVRVPLRPTDADVLLHLQALVDGCHERGRYHLLNYQIPLNPPLPPDDAVWAEQLLRQNNLI